MAFSALILLLASCTGFRSEAATLTQTAGPLSVAPGQATIISCTLQGVAFISSSHPSWYRQRPGNPPQLLLYEARQRASGIPDRFSGETYGNRGTLTIARAQADDEGDYYCAVWHDSAWIFGGGTQLTLTGQPASPPTVNLFPPSAEERQSKNKATLVCLMDSFNPGVVTVTWQADGATITNGVETTKPTKLNDKYVAASYLTLDKAEWERHEEYTCKVTHEGSPYTKTINHSQCA